jgi:hypothetical protein
MAALRFEMIALMFEIATLWLEMVALRLEMSALRIGRKLHSLRSEMVALVENGYSEAGNGSIETGNGSIEVANGSVDENGFSALRRFTCCLGSTRVCFQKTWNSCCERYVCMKFKKTIKLERGVGCSIVEKVARCFTGYYSGDHFYLKCYAIRYAAWHRCSVVDPDPVGFASFYRIRFRIRICIHFNQM